MGIMFFSIASIIMSFSMEIALNLRLYKIAADNGYILTNKNKEETIESKSNSNKRILALLTPGLNLMVALKNAQNYSNCSATILDQLRILDLLIPMTKVEKLIYEKDPRISTAFAIAINADNERLKKDLNKLKNDLKEMKKDYTSQANIENSFKTPPELEEIFENINEKFKDPVEAGKARFKAIELYFKDKENLKSFDEVQIIPIKKQTSTYSNDLEAKRKKTNYNVNKDRDEKPKTLKKTI